MKTEKNSKELLKACIFMMNENMQFKLRILGLLNPRPEKMKLEGEPGSCPKCRKDLSSIEASNQRPQITFSRPILLTLLIFSVLVLSMYFLVKHVRKSSSREEISRVVVAWGSDLDLRELGSMTNADKKYVEVFVYRQTIDSFSDYVGEAEAELSKSSAGVAPARMIQIQNKLSEYSKQTEAMPPPDDLGPCGRAIRLSISQAKSAVSWFWQYQISRDKRKMDSFAEAMKGSHGQSEICASAISKLLDEIKPDLNHDQIEIETTILKAQARSRTAAKIPPQR